MTEATATRQSQMSQAEWEVRKDLAAAYRLVALYGWEDLVFTHLSARVPGPEHHFLINPYGWLFDEITASSLIKVDSEGEIVDPVATNRVNPAGFTIHSAVHMAREEAGAVLHLHAADGVAVSAHKEGLLPLSQTAMLCLDHISFHDYEGVALNLDERERLVKDLGDKNMMLLRNHGTLLLGRWVAGAVKLALNLERSCKAQVAALGMGLTPVVLSDEVAEHTARQYDKAYDSQEVAGKPDPEWDAFLRRLDVVAPDYRG